MKLLDLEPAVSSDEIKTEIERGPLPESTNGDKTADMQRRNRQLHTGRNELPALPERVDTIIPCAPAQCTCGKCGGDTKVIGNEVSEVLDRKPAAYFVTRILREKRACADCIEQGVATAPTIVRIAPKSIFSDETIISFFIGKYCDATPLYRQRAGLLRDFGVDVALSTINDAVLRVSELLIPIVDWMKRDLPAGNYIQADETYVGVQTPDKKGENHTAYFWQYRAPDKGVVFDFEMRRSKEVPKTFFKNYGGILHTDGYAAYEKDIGTNKLIHACCLAHSRRQFIEAIKVQTKANVAYAKLERVLMLMDGLFAIDSEVRKQKLSLEDRHALRKERVPTILAELH